MKERRFMSGSRRRPFVVLALTFAFAALPTAASADAPDFAGQAFNILPPGQAGGLILTPQSKDQMVLYDNLTPLFDQVTTADLPNYFKPNVFGIGQPNPKRTEFPPGHPGVRIERDRFEVPHVYGENRDDVMFGAGWVTAEDRTLLMDIFRGPGRIAALDVPGLDPFSLALSFQTFAPTQQTEDFLAQQATLLQQQGPDGQRVLQDIDSYVEGVNAWRTFSRNTGPPWTRNDVLAVATLIGSIFGRGGGDESRRSELLSALELRLGAAQGRQVWNDLREQADPEAPVTIADRFTYQQGPPGNGKGKHLGFYKKIGRGNSIVDAGSLDTTGANSVPAHASNALLVGASRSSNGHPLFVAGPQVGYFYPQALYEADLHGGGIDARGATFPGSGPYVQLGRGQDYSWSATSAGNDIIDEYVETLCDGSDTKYLFKGQCLDMTPFDAGTLSGGRQVSFRETVHGPVIGYATVGGKRVAISQKRSTRGREVMSALGFADLNTNAVHDPQTFFDAANKIDFTFNWLYADDKHIAMFSGGRIPIRHPEVDLGLPTIGTGDYEWQGFVPENGHPHVVDPPSGELDNWNNKPAAGWPAADDQWSYGSIYRSDLLRNAVNRSQMHDLGSVVAAMNRAATQDLRNERVLPALAAVLDSGQAPSQRDARMLELLKAWRAVGSSRLDRDLNGKIDDPGAAILDAAWPKIANAVMSPVLGPQLDDLASLIGRDNPPNDQGSAFQSGWYGYVDKDLRTVAGLPVTGKFKTRFCGNGDLATCRASLWAAVDAAGNDLAASQGADPDAWRADANAERIVFRPRFLFNTIRWTNRPTFQQAISYSGHR
jgi:acyl-homoserine lactone acylase PvdQ